MRPVEDQEIRPSGRSGSDGGDTVAPEQHIETVDRQQLETGSKISVSYAHTSVLKHLLYRYTSMGQ
jgi:hypothetical protein